MLNLHGLDPSRTPDVETFWREVADPDHRAGAAPALLDHVAKNAEPAKYAYGSERKATGAIVHIGIRLVEPLSRGSEGRRSSSAARIGPACLPQPEHRPLILTSDGENVAYALEADAIWRRRLPADRLHGADLVRLESHDDPARRSGSRRTSPGRAKPSAPLSRCSRTRDS